MPITIGFQLRPVKKGYLYSDPHPIQIRIRVSTPATPDEPKPQTKEARIGAVWPLDGAGEKLLVNPADWDRKAARVKPKSHPANDLIEQLRGHVKSIYRDQKLTAPPTLGSILFQIEHNKPPLHTYSTGWQTVMKIAPAGEVDSGTESAPLYARISEESSLKDVYTAYIINLRLVRGKDRLSDITLGRWERGLYLMNEWEKEARQSIPACHKVTLRWLRAYHAWLQTQHGGRHRRQAVSAEQASRFIGKIGAVLQWLVDDELLTHNAVARIKWPRSRDKEIQFLEKEHIQLLFKLDWPGTAGATLWWFLLMACTGLDYPDAVRYAKNRSLLERDSPFGRKLVGRRLKPPYIEYDVPLLAEVETLFQQHPSGAAPLTAQCINRYTTHIEDVLGISWRITNKTARKTFGCLMLQAGHYVSEVARMMGHSKTSTTEKFYVRVLGNAVDRGRQRVGEVTIVDNPMLKDRMA